MSFKSKLIPTPKNEYVAWVDVMGIQSSMSRSIDISANFIFKFSSVRLNHEVS